MYRTYRFRSSDPQGLNSWATQLGQGVTIDQIAIGFLGSPEYRDRRGNGSDAGFLGVLYRDVLGREMEQLTRRSGESNMATCS